MPLQADQIRELQGRPELPEGSPTQRGAFVMYDGVDEEGDEQYVLGRPPGGHITKGHGDPNGEIVAGTGHLFIDVDAPALWQNAGYDAWTLVSGGTATTSHDYYLDPTGTSLSSNGQLTWVIAATVYPASDGLLDISTPTLPEVITPGIYTVQVWVDLPSDDLADQQIIGAMVRGGDALVTMVQAAPMSSTNTLANAVSFTMRHECEAGDIFFVTTQFSGGGSHSPYKLNATVEAEI